MFWRRIVFLYLYCFYQHQYPWHFWQNILFYSFMIYTHRMFCFYRMPPLRSRPMKRWSALTLKFPTWLVWVAEQLVEWVTYVSSKEKCVALSLLAGTLGAEKSMSRDRSEPFTTFSYKPMKDFLSFQHLVSFLFIRDLFTPRSKVIVSLNGKLIPTSDTYGCSCY